MYLYLLQHIILWACQQLWLAHAQAHKILQLLSVSLWVSPTWHVSQAGQQATSTLAYHLRVERPQQLWLACRLPTWLPSPWLPPPHWTRLLSRSQFEWSCPQDYCIDTYVIHLAWLVLICLLRFALTSDPNVFRYTSILNYIIVRHWYLLALVNSHLTFSAILWNHRFAIIYTLCMHLSWIMLCLLGFKSAHN